jgi:hypothetical protein
MMEMSRNEQGMPEIQRPTPDENSAALLWSARHEVRFYDDDFTLTSTVARFLADGYKAAQPCIVIATPSHRRSVSAYMKTLGVDVEYASPVDLLWLDARETLSSFMEGNRPSAELFEATVGSVFEKVVANRRYATVRAFGEMVDLLWRDGKSDAAIELEQLWNALAAKYKFALLCAYDRASIGSDLKAIQRICDVHTHAPSFPAPRAD